MRNLNIRWKFILSSFIVTLTTVLVISIASSVSLKNNLENEVVEYRQLEMDKARHILKSYVEIAIRLIDKAKTAADRGEISPEEAKKQVLAQIEQLRWDERNRIRLDQRHHHPDSQHGHAPHAP